MNRVDIFQQNFLCLCWVYIGYLLGIYWVSIGHLLGIYRVSSGYLSIFRGHLVDIYLSIFRGYLVDIYPYFALEKIENGLLLFR